MGYYDVKDLLLNIPNLTILSQAIELIIQCDNIFFQMMTIEALGTIASTKKFHGPHVITNNGVYTKRWSHAIDKTQFKPFMEQEK